MVKPKNVLQYSILSIHSDQFIHQVNDSKQTVTKS